MVNRFQKISNRYFLIIIPNCRYRLCPFHEIHHYTIGHRMLVFNYHNKACPFRSLDFVSIILGNNLLPYSRMFRSRVAFCLKRILRIFPHFSIILFYIIPFLIFQHLKMIIPIRAILREWFDCLGQLEGKMVFQVFSSQIIFLII
jgi:hypothetical protein